MTNASVAYPSLISVLWPTAGANRTLRGAALIVLGSLLLWASAKIHVPMWPVPMTMQTFAVMVIGLTFGPRLGALTVLFYLLEGAAGLPVFSGTPERGIGLAYMAGPTGGYLVGFFLAASLMGWFAARGWDRSIVRTAAAMAVGTVIIFACGLVWLSTLIGVEQAIVHGLMPFIAGAVVKLALGAIVVPMVWRLTRRDAAR